MSLSRKIENGRVECDHNNLINYSQKSSCTILCDEGYHITRNGESVITNGNFTEKTISTCDGNDDGNFIVDWNFSPINVTCEIVSLKYVVLKCVIMIGCRLAHNNYSQIYSALPFSYKSFQPYFL